MNRLIFLLASLAAHAAILSLIQIRPQESELSVHNQMDRLAADHLACKWFSAWYQGDRKSGAAWRAYGRCNVGVCDGVSDNHNLTEKIPCPRGGWYRNPEWFGYGKTWEEAFLNCRQHGYLPVTGPKPNGKTDWDEWNRFRKSLGLKPEIPTKKEW